MAYAFSRSDRSVEAAVRRICTEEIDVALTALAPLAGAAPDAAAAETAPRVHTARKTVKKVRGLLRLVRPGLDDYASANAALGAAGRRISALRDAEVMLTAFDRSARAAALVPADAAALRRPFEARKAAAEAPEDLTRAVAAFTADLRDLREAAAGWRVAGRGFEPVAGGLTRTLKDARRAAAAATLRDSTPDAVHTWRKRIKDHWYQCRLLRPLWPAVLTARIAEADAAGELLGEHNELSVLAALMDADGAAGLAAKSLRAALRARQAALAAEVVPISRRLLAGPPAAFADTMAALWGVWREG